MWPKLVSWMVMPSTMLCAPKASWRGHIFFHILHITSMLTYLAYFCIFFFIRGIHRGPMLSLCIFLHICAYFVNICAYFNLHIMAYLQLCIFKHILHISTYKHISMQFLKMHSYAIICIFGFAYLCVFWHIYAYSMYGYMHIFWFCIF